MNSIRLGFSLSLALLPALCVPSAAQSRPTSPSIDPGAMETLHRNQQAMLALKSYSAECRTVLTPDKGAAKAATKKYILSTITAAKPNLLRYNAWRSQDDLKARGWRRPSAAPAFTFVSDGKTRWQQAVTNYRKDNRVQPENLSTNLEPWSGFYSPGETAYGSALNQQKSGEFLEVRSQGREAVQGVPCDKVLVLEAGTENGDKYDSRSIWYFGPDHLARRNVIHFAIGGKPGITRDAVITNIKLNAPVRRDLFVYSPPPGVKLQKAADGRAARPAALAKGMRAPNFTALDSRNKQVKLSDYRGKVVVVDFWATWCGPCMASMPHTQSVMQKLKAEKLPVALLAVDDGEPRDDFDAWVAKNRSSLSALTFVHRPPSQEVSGSLFHVRGIPTQFVIDKHGIIQATFEGFGGPTTALERAVKAALAK